MALALFVLIRWWPYLGSPVPLGDEGIYMRAFAEVAAGHPADQVSGYYYPPTFAAIGAVLLETLGETATRALLRMGSVMGLALTIWIALGPWGASWSRKVLTGMVYLGVAPAVYYGIETGNLSFLVSGMIILSLALWDRRTVLSGLLLGTSVALKPFAPLTIVALAAHRPLPASLRQRLAGGIAGGIAALLILSQPGYLATTARAVDRLPFIRSISLNRILVLLDLEINPTLVAAVLALIVVLIARRYPMGRQEILCFGGVAAVLAVPIIWSHTLLLTLPVQILALTRAVERRGGIGESTAPAAVGGHGATWRRYELAFVGLAALALQLTGGAGAIDDQHLAFQLPVLVGAYLAAPALMAYVLMTGENRRRVEPARDSFAPSAETPSQLKK